VTKKKGHKSNKGRSRERKIKRGKINATSPDPEREGPNKSNEGV